MNWQKIETAPKDGRWLLLHILEGDENNAATTIGRWNSGAIEGEWMYEGMCPSELEPAYWMSMPEPPTQELA